MLRVVLNMRSSVDTSRRCQLPFLQRYLVWHNFAHWQEWKIFRSTLSTADAFIDPKRAFHFDISSGKHFSFSGELKIGRQSNRWVNMFFIFHFFLSSSGISPCGWTD